MPTDSAVVYPLAGKRVWVAGHRGMVGGALMRRLARERCELLTVGRAALDLRRQAEVESWIAAHKPQAIFLAAATVGGILANDSRPAEFLYDNLAIAANVIEAARRAGVEKLLFLGSACIYPGLAPQPMAEGCLLTGPLEPTNQWYSVAKIAGLKLCDAYRLQYGCDFISAMPNNLYGPGDNFDLAASHVAPALMRKIHEAKIAGRAEIAVWGSGTPLREFLHVDDLADALVFLMQRYSAPGPVNVGAGDELCIRDLAALTAEIVGWQGKFVFDPTRPDGVPRKLLDTGKLDRMGWRPRIALRDGLAETYRWYLAHRAAQRFLCAAPAGFASITRASTARISGFFTSSSAD
jgi:GDP-L-fucose synthase